MVQSGATLDFKIFHSCLWVLGSFCTGFNCRFIANINFAFMRLKDSVLINQGTLILESQPNSFIPVLFRDILSVAVDLPFFSTHLRSSFIWFMKFQDKHLPLFHEFFGLLLLRIFGPLTSSLLLYSEWFGRYVIQPSSVVLC